jgi:hypothetical protein
MNSTEEIPTMTTATDVRLTMQQFLEQYPMTMAVSYASANPFFTDERMNHWRCVLRFEHRQMTLIFSTGSGLKGEPSITDVLECLANDTASIENARHFEDWCDDYGYDHDSRKAERIYKEIVRQAKALRRLLGDESLCQHLLFDVERS